MENHDILWIDMPFSIHRLEITRDVICVDECGQTRNYQTSVELGITLASPQSPTPTTTTVLNNTPLVREYTTVKFRTERDGLLEALTTASRAIGPRGTGGLGASGFKWRFAGTVLKSPDQIQIL